MMPNELIFKKIEQIGELVAELEKLLTIPLDAFQRDLKHIRATERNFQLTVDLASDINTQLLLEQKPLSLHQARLLLELWFRVEHQSKNPSHLQH